jgi:succinate dehydrogenase hydrophobic anchor subunit
MSLDSVSLDSASLDSAPLDREVLAHAAPAAEESLEQREARAAWREWIVMAVATTLAILVVAGVAVLMGMG